MMHAVQINKFGDTSVLEDVQVDIPEPKETEVRIKINYAAFNPVSCKMRRGEFGGSCPMILGEDFSGIVDKVGKKTSSLKIGDEIYGMSFIKCSNGSNAEYTCVEEELVHKKPKNISLEEAASIPLAALTAYRAVISSNAIKKEDSVFISGIGGGVGSFAVQFLKHLGVKSIFTVAKNEKSKKFIMEKLHIPSENILIYDGLSISELEHNLIKMNGGSLFDATLDFVGGDSKELCIKLTKCSGKLVTILAENENFKIPGWGGLVFMKNIGVTQVFVGAELANCENRNSYKIYNEHLSKITKFIEEGVLKIPEINNIGILNAKTVEKAHNLLESSRTKGKIVMTIAKSE